jgi:hypothetical protein
MTDPITPPDPIAEENARLRRQLAETQLDLSETRKLLPKAPTQNLITRPEPPTFRRSDLKDSAFFAAHRKEILDAASHGRIVDDTPAWQAGSPESERSRTAARNRNAMQQAAKAKEGTR